jgi:hypothetical protein
MSAQGWAVVAGIVHGDRVACPLHNWNIRLETGAAVEPDVGCTARYPARVENGRVEVALDADRVLARATPIARGANPIVARSSRPERR